MRQLIIASLLIFSGVANAATYAWYSSYNGITRPSPLETCIYNDTAHASHYSFVMSSSGIEALCKYDGKDYIGGYIQRTGTSCPVGSVYNSTTGVCVSTTCTQTPGALEQVFSASKMACVSYPNLSPAEFCTWSSGKSTGYAENIVSSNSPTGPAQAISSGGSACVFKVTSAECNAKIDPVTLDGK